MKWRDYLGEAWRSMPRSLQRMVYGLLVAAAGLLVLSFVLPPDKQLWAVIGLFGLFVVVQGVILVRLWQQRPAVRQARRLFMQEDFEGVVRVLEADRDAGQSDAVSCTLLGNAYRQLGQLPASETLLREALDHDPASPFAAYGLGRTLLAAGQFGDAAALIGQAVEQGGQPVILIELALAHFYGGDQAAALAALKRSDEYSLEPPRMLMGRYLRWRLGELDDEAARAQLGAQVAGLALWKAEAARFASTPYGVALSADLQTLAALLADEDPA